MSDSEKTPWYTRWLRAIGIGVRTVARVIYEIVAPLVIDAALQFVNDADNQAAAVAAVKAAIARGLKGDQAWTLARDHLRNQFGNSAKGIADNWLDTLLQSAYFSIKNAIED